jgi:hypothetical protein
MTVRTPPPPASDCNFAMNADGSSDIYFGTTPAEQGGANWIMTVPGRGYFAGIRLHSPTQAYFDQTRKPDDIVKVK